MIANNLTVAIQASTVTALRAQASAGLTTLTVATCLVSAGNRSIYRWEPTSIADDDSITIIKPNDIAPANPGRWIIIDWIETATDSFHGELLVSVSLSTTTTSFAFQVGDDWTLVGMTEDAGIRRAWFKKIVQVPA